MISDPFFRFILAILFGAAVGLERESNKPNDPHVGGIRTFSLIALSGALAGIFFQHNYTALGLILVAGIFLLLIAYYVAEAVHTHNYGITSELSAMATFILGLMVMTDLIPIQITVAIFVIVIFVLSLKSFTTKLVAGLSQQEIKSFISYAIIALVVLPVLPDYSYKLKDMPALASAAQVLGADLTRYETIDLINPQKIWMIVVLITGIDVFGYILSRFVGNRNGFALTSFMAGFVSSTSATQSLAQRSKHTKFVNHLIGAAVLANLASFLQIFLLVGPLNFKWLLAIAPSIFIMISTAAIITYFFLKQKEPKEEEDTEAKKETAIFSLLPALKFATLLIVINITTKFCLIEFGQSGFLISSVIASFAGLDAIIVTLAEMAGNTISLKFAFLTFMLVNTTNLLSKSLYSYLQGSRNFAIKFLISVAIVAAAGASWLLFI